MWSLTSCLFGKDGAAPDDDAADTLATVPQHRRLKPAVQSAHAAQTVVSALIGAMTQKHHARAGDGRIEITR